MNQCRIVPIVFALAMSALLSCAGGERREAASNVTSTIPRGSEAMAAARAVMANAGEICKIYEEDPHLVVECSERIAPEQQLGFATAIANADAVLTGQARNIYFYLPGHQQFAQADRLRGVRLKD